MIRSKSPHALFTITTSNSATFLLLLGRHAQCDLHTTSDVVLRPKLNAMCTVPFTPGTSPKCCASDFTLLKSRPFVGRWIHLEVLMAQLKSMLMEELQLGELICIITPALLFQLIW